MNEVVSDPYDELPIRNDKYAASCTELHLGSKNITKLNNFHKFTNLSILWLNNNRITEINNLDYNVRLKRLYLHQNRIVSLENSSLIYFKFLEYLTLNDNLLTSISNVINELKYLKHLKYLDLFNNPISQEDNYRLLVIGELPWLTTLDRIPITNNEIKQAKKLKIQLKKLNNMKLLSSINDHDVEKKVGDDDGNRGGEGDGEGEEEGDGGNSSGSSNNHHQHGNKNILKLLLLRIKQLFENKRIFFQDICLEYDPRRLGYITQEDFRSCLIQFNILSQLSNNEYQLILLNYIQSIPINAISLSNLTIKNTSTGKTTIMKNRRMMENMVNYHQFCQDTLPSTLQYTKKSLSTTSTTTTMIPEKVPEISMTVKDLISSVKKYQQEEKMKNEKNKRDTLFNLSYNDDNNKSFTFYNTSNTTNSSSTTGTDSIHSTHPDNGGGSGGGLDPWLHGQLRTIFTEIALNILSSSSSSSSSSSTKKLTLTALCNHVPEIQFTSSHLMDILTRMELLGKTIKYYTKDEIILQILKNKNFIILKELYQIFQLDQTSTSTTTAATTSTNTATMNSKKKINFHSLRIEWRDLTLNERKQQEQQEFQHATSYLDTILRANGGGGGSGGSGTSGGTTSGHTPPSGNNGGITGINTDELFKLTLQKSINGTRMASTLSRKTNQHDDNTSDTMTPERVIRSAPNRSDIIVIPSLKSAAIRQQQEENFYKEYNWIDPLSKFGLKNERLEIALKRKQRSMTAATADTTTTALPTSATISVNGSTLPGIDNQRHSSTTVVKSKTSNFKSITRPPKGWSSTTGTVVLK